LSALGTLGLSVALVGVFVSIEARAKHLLASLGVSRTHLLPGDQAIPGRSERAYQNFPDPDLED
jgi:hypothetical protein